MKKGQNYSSNLLDLPHNHVHFDQNQLFFAVPHPLPIIKARHIPRLGTQNIAFLRAWFQANGQQRIDINVKNNLAQITNLTVKQIDNWIKRERRKINLNE